MPSNPRLTRRQLGVCLSGAALAVAGCAPGGDGGSENGAAGGTKRAHAAASFELEEVTIAANFGDMLLGIDAVGDDLLWLSSVGSPSVRVARMTVAGEA